jgi:hypothetical protein
LERREREGGREREREREREERFLSLRRTFVCQPALQIMLEELEFCWTLRANEEDG